MLTKINSHNKFLSSIAILSLPFLPFAGFFNSEPASDDTQISRTSVKKDDFAAEVRSPNLIAPGTNIGMWVWQREYVADPLERLLLLEFCQSHGIRSIFVQVHFDKTKEGNYVLANRQAWSDLLLVANALGIRVEALDGQGTMAFTENHGWPIARLKAVLDFNTSQPAHARFSGIHYDIEPYTTPRWKSGEHREIAVELLELLTKLKKVVSEADESLTFANDIPFWYDSNDAL